MPTEPSQGRTAPDFSPNAWRSEAHLIEQAFVPRGLPVSNSSELTRILNLPRRPVVQGGTPTAEALVEIAMQKYSRGTRECRCKEIDPDRPCTNRWLWIQAWGLYEIEQTGGLIASIAVGSGKTNLWLCAPLAMQRWGCRTALLLIPSPLIGQIQVDWQLLSEHMVVPNLFVHVGQSKTINWFSPYSDKVPSLHVLAYSRLSGIKYSDWIARLGPDLVIADEVDALADINSARTKRVLRHFETYPNTRFVGGTGSLIDNSVKEMAHLSALALWRTGTPLPTDSGILDEWASALDAVSEPAPPGALIRFLEPGEPTHNIRKAMHRRFAETPGFILVGGKQLIMTDAGREVDYNVQERKAPPIPPIVQEALDKVRDFVRPDTLGGAEQDEILFDKLEQARCVREVATGAFYKWSFPPINGVPQSRDLISQWFGARKDWHSEMRQKMQRGAEWMDSPKLCENAARRAWGDDPVGPGLPEWKAEYWRAWRDIRDQVTPVPCAVRLDPFLVDDAVRWAMEHVGILWVSMREFGEWAVERARELYGVELPYYGEGSGESILKEKGDRSVIASIKSHGRGRNKLQYRWHEQLISQSPASSRMHEQLSGRLHRRGQENDVQTWVYLHTEELEQTFEQALRRATFVKEIAGAEQKLLDGWDD